MVRLTKAAHAQKSYRAPEGVAARHAHDACPSHFISALSCACVYTGTTCAPLESESSCFSMRVIEVALHAPVSVPGYCKSE